MSSIFVAPGTNAREGQEAQQAAVGSDAKSLWDKLFPTLKNQFGYMASLEPTRQAMTNKILAMANPAVYGGIAAGIGNRARSTGMDNANYAAGLYGADSGIAKGAAVHAINSGAQAENDFWSHIMDPATQQQIYGGAISAINGSTPALGPAQALYGMVQGQHPITVGKGFGDYLAPIAGAALGNGGALSGLFSGGAGGGGWSGPTGTWSPTNGEQL